MALIDELKQQSKDAETLVEELNLRRLRLSRDISNALAHAHDLQIAIAALEPIPTPEEIGIALDEIEAAEAELLAEEEPSAPAEAEIPEGFTKWEGGVYGDFVRANPTLNRTETDIEVIMRNGERVSGLSGGFMWNHEGLWNDIIAYRVIEGQSEDEPAEFTSTLTGDPAVEGESGLHGEGDVWTQEQLDQLAIDATAFVEAIGAPQVKPSLAYLEGIEAHLEGLSRDAAFVQANAFNGDRTEWLRGWDDQDAAQIEAETHTDGVRTAEGETPSGDDRIDPYPNSVLNEPEFIAAAERAEATLAAEPAYIGLQDADLDAEFDAMKAREEASKAKPHRFGIWGGKREKVDA